MKVLPPWMIREGMNLTKEQRGEASQEVKMGDSSTGSDPPDDKKSAIVNDDESKNIQVHIIACSCISCWSFIYLNLGIL